MQESFKEYRSRKNKPFEAMETVFGSHSQKSVHEASTPYSSPTDADHDKLHANAPLNQTSLEPHQVKALTRYTRDSTMINGYLHNKHKGTNASEVYADQAEDISHALDKHKTKAPIDVYTGVPKSPSEHFHTVDGNTPTHTTVHLPAFTSTSTSLRKASEFSRETSHTNDVNHGIKEDTKHVLKIHVPKGSSAASVRSLSNMDNEHEILLNRGHNIQIHHEPEDIGHNTMLWHAKIISRTPGKI